MTVLWQTDTVATALAVAADGQMMVTWLDLTLQPVGWQGPVAIVDPQRPNPPLLSPGAPVRVCRLSDTNITALAVTAAGQMAVTWLDLSETNPAWRGPIAFGSPVLPPGAEFSEVLRQHL